MNTSIAKIAFLLSVTLVLGCGKKDADKAATGSAAPAAPAAGTAPAAPAPTAAAPTPAAPAKTLTAADVPPECKPFMDALEALTKCEKLPAEQRTSIVTGNQKMLKAMVDLHDNKASIDGCNAGLPSLQQALKTAGC
jgi:Tfp pilus assembly protein FimV